LTGCQNEKAEYTYIPQSEEVDMSGYIGIESVHCFRLIKLPEMDKVIKSESSGIFYVGHESCSYCQSLVQYLNKAGIEAGVTIYYIDCYDLDYPLYSPDNEELYIDDLYTTLREDEGEKAIYTPQVFTVVNGIVKDSQIAAKDWEVADPTSSQIEKLIKNYKKMFEPFVS